MANNSVAYGRGGAQDVFADDDPLAELARIAGFDERSPLRPAQAQPARREPAFNLEDELLRELENYEDPRPEPAVEPHLAPVAAPVGQPLQANRQPERVHAEPLIAQAPVSPRTVAPVSDPFADEEFDALDRRDPMSQTRDGGQFGVAPKRNDEVAYASVERREPVSVRYDEPVSAPPAPSEPSGLDMDLISELETSLLPVEPQPRPVKTTRPPARAYEPGFRMPLANFNPASVPRHEPSIVAPEPNEPAPSRVEAAAAVGGANQSDSSVWEEELARVAAFAMAPQATARQTPAGELPQVEAFRNEDRAAQARLSADLPPVSSIPPLPEFATVDQQRDGSGRVHKEPAFATEPADDFELALDEIEFDLSDLMEEEMTASVGAASASAPEYRATETRKVERNERVEEPSAFAAAFEPRPEPRSIPVSVAAVPAFLANSRSAAAIGVGAPQQVDAGSAMQSSAAPQRSVPQPAMGEDLGDGEAFDPALLADTDEMPEAVPDLNVPELPAHEPEQRPVQHSEFDIDLDAELASFLTQANAAPQSASVVQRGRSAQPATMAAEAKPAARPSDGLDDFERALEEDFRRSLQTPFPARPLREDAAEDDAIYLAPRKRVNWVLPASAAGFVAIIGLSAYAFYASHGSKLTGDGAPVVIAADTQPVKVAPENPGGKIVPNQDKAVYDRVATGTLDAPKQSSLISSDEQPVDVVQKTLETLPMETDGEGLEATSTPVGQTEDARLLPQQTANAANAQDQLAVMPRKVKTMVVRPDGTLVEQIKEVPAKPGIQAPVSTVKTEKVPAAPALAEPTKTAAVAAEPTKISDVNVAKTTPITGSTPVNTAPASAAAKTQAPVPGARPADQPVKVVAAVNDQGAIRPTTSPATPVAANAQSASQSSGAGGYYIQVASLPSEADAQKSYKNLSAKFGGLIAGRGVDIAKAEVAGKGTFYRVRIPAGSSKDEAAALCEKLRAAGGTCLIAR